MADNKISVLRKIVESRRRIRTMGIKGSSLTFGNMVNTIQERFEYKYLLKDLSDVRKNYDILKKDIKDHKIVDIEEDLYKVFDKVVDGIDNSYAFYFHIFLSLDKSWKTIEDFERKKKFSSSMKNKVFGDYVKGIISLLDTTRKYSNSFIEELKGRQNIPLMKEKLKTTTMYIIDYIRGRKEIKSFNKDLALIANDFKHLKSDEDFNKLKRDLEQELRDLHKLLKDHALQEARLLEYCFKVSSLLHEASKEKEVPKDFDIFNEESSAHKVYYALMELIHNQVHNIHLMINQLDTEVRKVA